MLDRNFTMCGSGVFAIALWLTAVALMAYASATRDLFAGLWAVLVVAAAATVTVHAFFVRYERLMHSAFLLNQEAEGRRLSVLSAPRGAD